MRADPCAGYGRAPTITIWALRNEMYLCDRGKVVRKYPIAISKGLTGKDRRGKRKLGDMKVPLGSYRLGMPKRNRSYHLFIDVGYPTPKQRKAGYTGSGIGIHGPDRKRSWRGGATSINNWTRGCFAVETDAEIEAIARWVRKKRPRRVRIFNEPPTP